MKNIILLTLLLFTIKVHAEELNYSATYQECITSANGEHPSMINCLDQERDRIDTEIQTTLNSSKYDSFQLEILDDIGFALSEIGNQSEALKLLYAVEQVTPKRAVLMLNIADALWISGNRSKSKEYYEKYQHIMTAQNKISIIPMRVNERLRK